MTPIGGASLPPRIQVSAGQQEQEQKKKKPQDPLTAMDFLKGVRYEKGYIEPLIHGVYGVGETYSGLYYVDEVTHSFTAVGYRQSFKLERNPTG